MTKTFEASTQSRLLLILFVPCMAMVFVAGVISAVRGEYLGSAILVVVAMLVALYCFYEMTARVEMDDHSITRTWLFGRTVVPLSEIHCLSLNGTRGVLLLTISYGKKHIVLSSNSLEKHELREIQRLILVSLGLEGEPLLPAFAEQVGYVNIGEMLARKHRA